MLFQYYPTVPHGYKYEVNKDFHFAAAHFIPDVKAGKCARLHGHTYVVNLTVVADELDDLGFVADFNKLKQIVHDKFDHHNLNRLEGYFSEIYPEHYPTTEVLARKIWKIVQDYLDQKPNKPICVQVIVRETPSSYVRYQPDLNELYKKREKEE